MLNIILTNCVINSYFYVDKRITDGLYEGKITDVFVDSEIFNRPVDLTIDKFNLLTEGISGKVRLGPCPICYNLAVYIENKPTHRTDLEKTMCLIEG
jgi:hypothetical protein